MSPTVVAAVQSRFGAVLHNFYGSTEASYISIATPGELADDTDCAGRPALGVQVDIVRDGEVAPTGRSGEIYVKTAGQITQDTDGRSKETRGGMLSTGDVGWFDSQGRLYVQGRADGMIVSSGENVFPEIVELTLLRPPEVDDAKVVAVDDPEFGQTLTAIVAIKRNAIEHDTLRRILATQLSRSWVPRRFVFVPAIARTATGKVSRASVDAILGTAAQTPPRS
jgi:fatty-acyl-CoA synthase